MINYTKIVLGLVVIFFISSCSKSSLDFLIQEPEKNTAPAEYVFIDKSEGFDQVVWDFGDGSNGKDSIALHKYFLSGKYKVKLKGQKGKKTKELSKEIVISAPLSCLVYIETNMGNMLVELFDETPLHRDNFLKLAEQGFYDNLIFHRVINGFMIQGGDPDSRDAGPDQRLGSGGPGYQIPAEFSNNLAHVKGYLSAARMGDGVNPEKKSSGSQFYIVQGKRVVEEELTQLEYRLGITYPDEVKKQYLDIGGTPFLDQNYTVFGRVIDGLDVIDAIASVNTNRGDRPIEDIVMKIKVIK